MVQKRSELKRAAATLAALGLVTFAVPAAAQTQGFNPGRADAEKARELAAQGNCGAALTRFDTAVVRLRTDPTVRRDRGKCHDQLGNPMPAIEDYRAYLSMAPNAPDAFKIRQRLDALESEHLSPAVAPDHDRDGRKEDIKTPQDLEDPFAIEDPNAKKAELDDEYDPVVRVPARGWLLGPYLGWRKWENDGPNFNDTLSFGAIVGYAYRRGAEFEFRGAYLKTKSESSFGGASGFGISAAHYWKVGLNRTRTLELMLGAGFGFERQETSGLGLTFNFFLGRLNPMLRWAVTPAITLQGGPEVGGGAVKADVAGGASASAEEVLYYGIAIAALWRFGVGSGDDRHDTVDPDEPLEEEDLWDD